MLALNIAVQWALEQRRISAFEFRVLVTLARESVEVAPSEFACLIRHEDLGQRCEMSERAAQTALRNLVGKRLITIEPTFRANGKRGENRYTLATMS